MEFGRKFINMQVKKQHRKKLLIATKNPGKLNEFKKFLSDLPLTIVSLNDIGIDENVLENGKTYQENSQKKALFYAKKTDLPALSDDGGIEISALGNKPGVHSKRWLGYEATDQEIMKHLTKVAKELPDTNRKATFKTVVSLALPNGKVWSMQGEVEGIIAKEPKNKLIIGFPFRQFFYIPQIKKYYQDEELTEEEQRQYNHRYKAAQKIKRIMNQELGIKGK